MNLLHLPWLELAIGVSLLGALCVSRIRTPGLAARWGLAFTGTAFVCAFLAWLAFYQRVPTEALLHYSWQPYLFGRQVLAVDSLSAPLVPAVALLHFLTALATARTKMRRFSFSWSLASEALRLALFSTTEPWVLIGLLGLSTLPPLFELVNRGKPIRVYALHMGLFMVLLVAGWSLVQQGGHHTEQTAWAAVPLLAAVLVRCGTVPVHCWLTDWFENASFGNAVLFVAPLVGVYVAVRLVLPIAPDWVLQSIGVVSLATAVYAAGMAVIQREARRFFAYLFLSHSSLVLVGLELVGTRPSAASISLTGALCLWFSVTLSLGGFGLTLRALEARYGRLSLTGYHGLYEQSPTLALCFLLTGLASVGFPCTLGFVSTDILVDGAVQVNLLLGIAVVAAAALNGIAVVRAYFLLFTGARHSSTVSLRAGKRERVAVLTLAVLILGGGLFPQPGVNSRHEAAEKILQEREREHPHARPKTADAQLKGEEPHTPG
jgi:NADH-quinone oxidoreductase subunit M